MLKHDQLYFLGNNPPLQPAMQDCHLYGEHNHTKLHKELSYEQNIGIIDKLYDYFGGRVPRIKFSGGEPFIKR